MIWRTYLFKDLAENLEVRVDDDLVVAVPRVGHAGEVAPGPDRPGRARRGGGFAREI